MKFNKDFPINSTTYMAQHEIKVPIGLPEGYKAIMVNPYSRPFPRGDKWIWGTIAVDKPLPDYDAFRLGFIPTKKVER